MKYQAARLIINRGFMMKFLQLISFACLVFLVACASKNAIQPTPLSTVQNEQVVVKKQWQRSLGADFDKHITRIKPAIAEQYIYAVNESGTVYCLNLSKGKTIWKQSLDQSIKAGISAAYGQLALVANHGLVILLSAKTGEVQWQTNLQANIFASPVIDSTYVYVQTLDNQIIALQRETGREVWRYKESMPLVSLWGSSQPQLYNDWLIAGMSDGTLMALEKTTGKEVWSRQIGIAKGSADLEQLVDLDSQFIIDGATLWAASYQDNIVSMSLIDGQLLWYRDLSSHTNLALNDGQILLSDNNSDLYSLSAYTGDIFWQKEILKGRQVNALAAYQNYVLASDYKGYLHIFDQETGTLIGREHISSGRLMSAPIIYNDTVYLLTEDSDLVAIQIKPIK